MRSFLHLFVALLVLLSAELRAQENLQEPLTLASPDGNLQVAFRLGDKGAPQCDVAYRGTLVASAALGLSFADAGPLAENLRLVDARRYDRDETYSIPVGKASQARDHHHELIVSLKESVAPGRRLEIAIRAFDDGAAFRYLIPSQDAIGDFVLMDELTQFTFPGDPTARLLPLNRYTTSYEKHYQKRPISKIDSKTLIGLPLLLERPNDGSPIWLAITEANLIDYAGMYLAPASGELGTFAAKLSPLPNRGDGAKVIAEAPHASPWRVLMIGDDPGRLLESHLVFHLNEPSAIKDTSWIKPGKTTFPWWNGYVLEGVDFEPGLNTATHKHYIDFCAEQGIEYHSLDGTDTAWYGGPITPNAPTDVTKAVPEIDLPELLRYAKKKGIRLRLWMHWRALRPQLDEALALYEQWGIEGVMIDFMDRDDQEMIAFYHEVAEKAARHRLTVTWHGAYKPTGMERTWPNVLTYEAALNQEYNKCDRLGTPPAHNLDIAFVRMLAGPLDYHQGGMRNVLPRDFRPRQKAPLVQGTRGHQLAMYVVYQDHLPMLVDYPAAYRNQPGLDFLVQVPTSWDESHVLQAEMDHCLVIARRKGDVWYLGGMSGAEARDVSLALPFLGDGSFVAEMYLDDPSGGSRALMIERKTLTGSDTLRIAMPAGGGFAARLTPER